MNLRIALAIALASVAFAADAPTVAPTTRMDACQVGALNLQAENANLTKKNGDLLLQITQLNYEILARTACENAGIKRDQCEVDQQGTVKAKTAPPSSTATPANQ